MTQSTPHVAIIGAGIGGLAAALRLAHQGVRVTVLERHSAPGGKMRTYPSTAGPIDAGPTVLTLKPVFEALFADVGQRLEDHVTLESQDILARHFWPDGTTCDLMHHPAQSSENIRDVFGAKAASEFDTFSDRARRLYDAFETPMMQAAAPSVTNLTLRILRQPNLISAMAPLRSLAQSLNSHFSDPHLAQLFARYATYVGGLPAASPALLGLIWEAERRGVWHVRGGMHKLAQSIASCAASFGATFLYDTHVTQIDIQNGNACGVCTADTRLAADAVLFNGDPMALASGNLGQTLTTVIPHEAVAPRSLSASVLTFAAQPHGVPLSAHNVFFADDPASEYTPLSRGQMQPDPTLYVCAQDRFNDAMPIGLERFEIILNSPPILPNDPAYHEKVKQQCHTLILDRLNRFGLTFSPQPTPAAMTAPQDFDTLFPASAGSLYGRSPHGMMAAFQRPAARTQVGGLYLAGGGAHPGAGIPMATLSAKHAAEAILTDLSLTFDHLRADTRGGTSTGSAMTARVQSRLLGS